MSLSDTIDAIIKESSSVERELRWFLSALPAIVSTENSAHRNPLRHIPDFEKNQLFYLRPDLPHSWLFPAHS